MCCYGCGEAGHKVSNYPKAEWNKGKYVQGAGPRNPQPITSQGRPSAPTPAQRNRNFKKSQAEGRVYYLENGEEENEDPHVVVLGALLVNHLFTRVLFDAGTTHSFINPTTAKRLA